MQEAKARGCFLEKVIKEKKQEAASFEYPHKKKPSTLLRDLQPLRLRASVKSLGFGKQKPLTPPGSDSKRGNGDRTTLAS